MANPRFQANIIIASRRLQDGRTIETISEDTGKRWTLAELEDYQNRAIRNLIRDTFNELGEAFGSKLPELVATAGSTAIVGGSFARPAGAFRVISARTATGSTLLRMLPPNENPDKVRTGKSVIHPGLTNPYFYEEGDKVFVLPSSFAVNVFPRYIQAWVSMVLSDDPDDPDLPFSEVWDGEIVDRMVQLAQVDSSKATDS
jgi:hypothetical protein